jgi:biotin transport system substrate-specific component
LGPRAHRLRMLTTAALLAALTAVCSLLAIPNPLVPSVPFTLQVFAVCLAGCLLPPGWAFAAEAVYLFLGFVGVPVFAGGAAGPAVLVGVTGGFLWGYPPAAALASWVGGRRGGFWRLLAGSVAAIAAIYAFGFAGMVVFGHVAASWASVLGLLSFLPWDLVKAVLASAVALRVRQALAEGVPSA